MLLLFLFLNGSYNFVINLITVETSLCICNSDIKDGVASTFLESVAYCVSSFFCDIFRNWCVP